PALRPERIVTSPLRRIRDGKHSAKRADGRVTPVGRGEGGNRMMLRWLTVLLLVAAVIPVPGQAAPPSQRPNIVFILADDLGWTDWGCDGSSFYETPNLARLAARGMRFTRAYAACPVCSPTRASILTGKYPVRVGVTDYINPPGSNQPEQWKRNTRLLPAPY